LSKLRRPIEHDIGVSDVATIEIKRLDNDYFEEK